jgi:hypothetical protein
MSSNVDDDVVGEVEPGFDLAVTALINSVGVGILVCDVTGKLAAINTVGLHMLGAGSPCIRLS